MKAHVILLLLTLTAAASADSRAQQAAAAPTPPGHVAVVKFSWRRERVPGWENNQFGAPVESYEAMRERVINERRIQQARNSGNKGEVARREDAAKMADDARYTETKKGEKQAERPRDGYRYRVEVRNDGAKTVKQVDWDYLFLDPRTRQEVSRHQFTSEETIKPGRSKELGVFYLAPPVQTVSADRLGQKNPLPYDEQVVIVLVRFSDGSTWQRP